MVFASLIDNFQKFRLLLVDSKVLLSNKQFDKHEKSIEDWGKLLINYFCFRHISVPSPPEIMRFSF